MVLTPISSKGAGQSFVNIFIPDAMFSMMARFSCTASMTPLSL
jgi:hypothetical protein